MKRTVAVLVGLIVVLLIGAGVALAVLLSQGGGGGEGKATEAKPAATAETKSKASESGQPGQPKSGGQITMLGGDPPTLDPALSSDATSAAYVVEIFSGLVTLVRDGDGVKLAPDIADSWDVSSDGRTYTFHLNKDAKFHGGRAVTAQDFKYSFERAARTETESTVAEEYLGDIVGAADVINGRAKEMRGVTVIDDHTLQVQIDVAKSYFLYKLTYPTAFVVDKANVEQGRKWTDKPNGTGPFKLKEWRKGERIVLERNPSYYRGPAHLNTVTFLLSGGSSMTMYENNEVDISGVGLADMERVRDPSNPLNKQLVISENLDIGYIGFNVKTPPFDDPKVRQALVRAVNTKLIIDSVLQGLEEPAKGILPPGMPGFNKDLKGLAYDPALAKKLISESKYGSVDKLPPVTVTIPGSGATVPPTSEAVIQMWKDNLGLSVQIQQVEWATFLSDLSRKRFQMFEAGWIADYPDPHDFLDILLYGGSTQNHTNYNNPDVNKLLEQARVERDEQKRMQLYQQVEQMIVDDAAWLPLWHSKNYLLVKPYVKNYFVAPMVIPILKDVYIDKG
ncbi:MAG: peptide ABC transporter substrate-binding protein [Chloroflexi bacterium]|nr:peptide ABC transporter substrate-binding protein [Chloroflexota bacterium]